MDESRADELFPWRRVSNVALAAAALFAAMALARYRTWHNETFDLAFYARLVWGAGRFDLYNPLVGASLWGLHLSPILLVLGALGRVLPLVPMLLVLQATCVAAAGIPLARIAQRRVGHPVAPYAALAVYLLLPVVGSVASYEFHPSALALLPLSVALDRFDARRVRDGCIALFVAALCREDVALVAGLTGLSLALRKPHRAVGLAVFAAFTLWFGVYLFVVAPRYLPRHGSLQLHYGHLGSSPADIARALLAHPVATLRALATPARCLYAPRMLVPVAFLSLLRPRWLLPALAPVAINLLSQFPTAVQVHSHYSALLAPFVVASAIHGAAHLMSRGALHAERYGAVALAAALLGSAHMQHRAGVIPVLGGRFDVDAHRPDGRMAPLDTAARLIPPDASYTGPDFTLSHFAERRRIFRFKQPPDRAAEYLILSMEHRARFAGTQEIWRNAEEVTARNALFWPRYGVYTVLGPYVVMRERWPVRAWARGRYVEFTPDPRVHASHVDIGDDLAVAGWGAVAQGRGSHVVLLLVAKRRWPYDLGFELGWGEMRPHLDREDPAHTYAFLPFDGAFMPSFVRVGEVVRTEVDVPASLDELRAHGLRFGPRRIDGSRLEPATAHWTLLPERAP